MRGIIVTFLTATSLLCALAGAKVRAGDRGITRINKVQSVYLEHCGGCHGIQGTSVPGEIPSLRGQVASFLCTAEGRAYLIRLPNVALAPVTDEMLADVMNFIVFEVGRPSESELRALLPYSAEEVAELRRKPLTDTGLAGYRTRIVEELIERCGAPSSLRQYRVRAAELAQSSK